MLKRSVKTNPVDAALKAENRDIIRLAQNIGLGHGVTHAENERIKELNKRLSATEQLLTAESWEQIHGKKYDNFLD